MPRVRTAVLADADRIGEIHVRSWQDAYRAILPDEFLSSLSVEARVERWRNDLASMDASSLALVVEEDLVVNGFARLAPSADGKAGEVQAIYLDPGLRRRGLGRYLLTAAERSLAAMGWSKAILWVLEDNREARLFYEALGWQRESRRAFLNIGGAEVQEIRYRKAV